MKLATASDTNARSMPSMPSHGPPVLPSIVTGKGGANKHKWGEKPQAATQKARPVELGAGPGQIPHYPEGIPDCGNFEVWFADGCESQWFYWDDNRGRASTTRKMDQEQAR